MTKCTFTSIWDDDSEVTTNCLYDEKTGAVSPEVSRGRIPTGMVEMEYITLSDGTELEVCHYCHEYVMKTTVGNRADLSYGEITQCSNKDCGDNN